MQLGAMAIMSDLEHLVSLLANDVLGNKREDPSLPLNNAYIDAF